MSYGYMRPDPVTLFADRAGFYRKLIEAAEKEGFTRQEAIEILKVDKLHIITEELANGNY